MKNNINLDASTRNSRRTNLIIPCLFAGIMLAILVSGCELEFTPPQSFDLWGSLTWPSYPSCEPKDLKIKVLEYGAGLPISNTKIDFSTCSQISGGQCIDNNIVAAWHTDAKGEINISRNEFPNDFNYRSASKENYWSIAGDKCSFYRGDVFSTENQDSIVLQMFPYSWLKLHIKNQNQYADSLTIHMDIAMETNDASYAVLTPAFSNLPANNTDTSFVFKTYGNVTNRLDILLDSAGVSMQIIYTNSFFVNKNDTLFAEILY